MYRDIPENAAIGVGSWEKDHPPTFHSSRNPDGSEGQQKVDATLYRKLAKFVNAALHRICVENARLRETLIRSVLPLESRSRGARWKSTGNGSSEARRWAQRMAASRFPGSFHRRPPTDLALAEPFADASGTGSVPTHDRPTKTRRYPPPTTTRHLRLTRK